MIIDKRPKPLTTPVARWHSSHPSHPPPSHPASRARGEVTFWIAPQVGKISNGAYLHMADSVHTSFVWREWFPTGPLAGLSRLHPHSGDGTGVGGGRAPSCTTGVTATAGWPPTSPLSGFISPLPSFKSIPHPPPSPSVSSASDPASLTPPHHQLSSALQRLQIATYLYDGGVDYTAQCPIGEAGSILEERLRPLRRSTVARLTQKSLGKQKKKTT